MEEKRHEASAWKLRKRREAGEVAKSVEFVSGGLLVALALLLWGLGGLVVERLEGALVAGLSGRSVPLWPVVWPIGVVLVALVGVAMAFHIVQVGWLWKRRERGKKVWKSPWMFVIKVGALCIVGFVWWGGLWTLAWLIAGVWFVVGVIDLFVQKWRFRKRMRMSDEEKKEEKKETGLSKRQR